MTGGKQERSRRAGTENVPALVGLGVAAELAQQKMAAEAPRLSALRDRLEAGVLSTVPDTERNGAASPRVPNTTNISIDRVEAESLLIGLDLAGIAVSSGSACSSGTLEPSHVLKAMGLPHARTLGSIRFSLGAANTDADVDRVHRSIAADRREAAQPDDRRRTKITHGTRVTETLRTRLVPCSPCLRDSDVSNANCRSDVRRRGFVRGRGPARRAGS